VIIAESDWYKSFSLDVNFNDLLVWTRKHMVATAGMKSNPYDHETALYWQTDTPDELKDRCSKIAKLNEIDGCNHTYIWEYWDGGPLVKHFDGQYRGASLVIPLIGNFNIHTYDKDDNIRDTYAYKPGKEVFVLKNGHKMAHAGECTQGYRLALLLFVDALEDPFRDLDEETIDIIKSGKYEKNEAHKYN
jgi:hypothetical protein